MARDRGSAADMIVGPAVARDLGNADMVVGLDHRGGPAAMLDLGGAADMFVGLDVGSPDRFAGPAARSPSARERGVLETRT